MSASTRLLVLICCLFALALHPAILAQEPDSDEIDAPAGPVSGFTYQGRLQILGVPANGSYDLQLALYDQLAAGGTLIETRSVPAVAVSDGVFTVAPGFAATSFPGAARYLEIRVRPAGSLLPYTTLIPRQPITPAPYALYSLGGLATDVACSECVASTDLAASAVTKSRLAAAGGGAGYILGTGADGSTLIWTNATSAMSGLAPGQIVFGSATGGVGQKGSLFWDNVNNRLGLGTATPSERLEMTGNLKLPATAATAGTPTAGALYLGNTPFLHAFSPDPELNNTFVGYNAGNFTMGVINPGSPDGNGNTAVGANALHAATEANRNVAIGMDAMAGATIGYWNVAVGHQALMANTNGVKNVALGMSALYANEEGYHNTAVGFSAMDNGTTGNRNTAVGVYALRSAAGSGNVAIGAEAGLSETGSNKLYIANSSDDPPLIYGEFDTKRIGLQTITPTETLSVEGTVGIRGTAADLLKISNTGAASPARGLKVTAQADTAIWATRTSGTGPALDVRHSEAGGNAASFTGNVGVTGNLNVTGTKNFLIEHPLDPTLHLAHAAVESHEVLNTYSGNTILDAHGEATVTLPEWFEAINRDERYQLTPIGASAPGLFIAEEVTGNRFRIAGGSPGLKVSWQVTALRNDAWMRAHPFEAVIREPAQPE